MSNSYIDCQQKNQLKHRQNLIKRNCIFIQIQTGINNCCLKMRYNLVYEFQSYQFLFSLAYIKVQMQKQKKDKGYYVIGMMSGTSLDGIDLSLARYFKNKQKWEFQMIYFKTYEYSPSDIKLIKQMQNKNLTYLQFRKKQIQYSDIVVDCLLKFINDYNQKIQHVKIDAVGLHGHTIFHNPKQGITAQIGNLQYIAAKTKMNVIGNFRQLDIHRGGEGAPLAPFGQQLFGQQMIFLNLGGIANVGFKGRGYDIVFCNMVLNKYSQKIANKLYDQDGIVGSSGNILQNQIQMLKYKFNNQDNHSLAREQVQSFLQQIQNIKQQELLRNKMRSFYEFIAVKINQCIYSLCCSNNLMEQNKKIKIYCTGGGAFNKFLMKLMNENKNNLQFVLPNPQIVNFKQSLIFGLLAVKFLQSQNNCCNGIGGQLVKG